MPKYTIQKTDILHDGTLYAEGSEITLTEDKAKTLQDYLILIPETKTTKTTKSTSTATKTTTSADKKEAAETDGGAK